MPKTKLRERPKFQTGPLPNFLEQKLFQTTIAARWLTEMDNRITRRRFLAKGTEWAGASLLGVAGEAFGALTRASLGPAVSGTLSRQIRAGSGVPTDAHGMIVYSEEYLTREMPVSFLDSWITPSEHFFVRDNERMPQINLADWRLSITGEVARPQTLAM